MKLIAPLVLSCLAFTTGCVRRYEVTLTNQRVITAHGKPKYDKEQGTFRFKDSEGRVHVVPAFTIREIAPR
ncbi:MAG TPA: YgdI/YgdR family lipoprotein [Verrucomicrobiae bacterium]|nr:YgdI/YgdR family lipoprotein [Verrucomicrobiae bacterium]